MKLVKEEIIRTADTSPLQLFEQGIRNATTRRKYTATPRRVMCEILEDILAGDFEECTRQFVQHAKDDPDWATDIMLSVSWKLRERTRLPKDDPDYLNPTSLPAYFKPIKKLFDMNSVSIPWKRVYATFPEKDNIHDTKGWTRDEIAAMLEHTRDPMDKAMVLVLASSGVRLGGLELTWGDLTPIYPLTLANFSSQLRTPPVEGRSRPAYRSTSRTCRSAHRWTLARCTFRVICRSSTGVMPSGDTPIANSIRAIRMALGGEGACR